MIVSQTLRQQAPTWGLTLTESQLDTFEIYCRELTHWNQRVNLTRIIDPAEIVVKHFLDSLSIYPPLANLVPPFSVIDVGSGAGFPGLPLKIIQPDIALTLVEATKKKCLFLQYLVETLQLRHVTVVAARIEEVGQQAGHREQYDVAVARAVAALPVLVEYTLPLVKIGGQIIAQKGQHPADELTAATNALQTLGGGVPEIIPIKIPHLEAKRHLVIIKKISSTPAAYPRRPGLPAKRPL